MKKSTAITLTLLGSAMLVAWCGCGGLFAARHRTLYDSAGHPVPRSQWLDAEGKPKTLYDDKGQPVPPDEVNAAYASTAGTTTTHYRPLHSSYWSSPFYSSSRSWSSYPSYSGSSTTTTKSSTNTGSTYFGGSKPNTTSPSSYKPTVSSSSKSSGGSTSRGGFGSTGSSSGSSSS
ncbi:hypothetical protein BH11PLA2_BH11PLA2_31870 [soil metagenome]